MSKYKLKTPSKSFSPKTEKSTSNSSPLEFKKGTKSFADICGLENPGKDRIVGGHEAAENEWPWQVCVCICTQWYYGLSRLLSSLTMPGSVEAPSSLINTS